VCVCVCVCVEERESRRENETRAREREKQKGRARERERKSEKKRTLHDQVLHYESKDETCHQGVSHSNIDFFSRCVIILAKKGVNQGDSECIRRE
jgi:hypothetical protein